MRAAVLRATLDHLVAHGYDGLSVTDVAAAAGVAATTVYRRWPTKAELAAAALGGRAEVLPAWYAAAITAGDERPLLAACPDHDLSRTRADGGHEVIETTGGAPLPVRMRFDDGDTTTIRTPADPAFPVQWVSTARASDGTPIGGVRHQFRDRPGDGFDTILTVELPVTTPPHMVAAHRWHLACEFSIWLETINA